jgi:hypothetical protein
LCTEDDQNPFRDALRQRQFAKPGP